MASFRTGFKIFGEISLKQGLGRIRSFSEDRKPGHWLPEDQWAVRQPGSTCPDPCANPKKPSKPSKSWLSICKDPDLPKEPECDIRHNNCPSPVRSDAPWYSLEKLMPKKKSEKTPPLQSCREEIRRRELFGEDEEVCECIEDKSLPPMEPDAPEYCAPKEPCPAPVINLSCPLPKELDIMLWCGQPSAESSRIAAKCQTDRLPYDEFTPPKTWKPPPFALPIKNYPSFSPPRYCPSSIAFEEFKYVEVPKPLYTRYKSVELGDSNLLLCMREVQCPDDQSISLGIKPLPPPPSPTSFTRKCCAEPSVVQKKEKQTCPEKRIIEAGSCRPVKIKKAAKYTFRPKPTKLVERRVHKNPLANKAGDFKPPEKKDEVSDASLNDTQPPKVITGTLTHEPQMFEGRLPVSCKPPKWMYALCKPGCKETPLVPSSDEFPQEPDWCSETDGLKFYDNNNGNIYPKPPPDPYLEQKPEKKVEEPPPPKPKLFKEPPRYEFRDRFVLMPESYNIKNMRMGKPVEILDESKSFDKFLESKAAATLKTTKSYPTIKENILYDLQRLCPNPPIEPSKIKSPPRKPPTPECSGPPRFHCKKFSTFTPSTISSIGKFCSLELYRMPRRTECGDSSGKCKARALVPKPKPCPEPSIKPDCAEITLPCCPKAKVPPDCDKKRPMPICKKKLPPKPSFSECSKDPLPCPKMTECDCWEKKNKRKYSDWAIKRAEFDGRQAVKNTDETVKMEEVKQESKHEQPEMNKEKSST